MQVIWIKWLLFFHQRPGNNQHLGGQFNSHFGFNAALTLSTAQHMGEVSAKVRVGKNRGDAYDFMRFESNSTLKMYEKESMPEADKPCQLPG